MKRLILAAVAMIALGVPMAAPAFADPQRGYGNYEGRRDHDRRDYDRRDYDRRDYDRRDYRGPDRVGGNYNNWQGNYNNWQVGSRINWNDGRYRQIDYRDHRLREPPRGYGYVRNNNTGEIALAVIATGLIASLILN